MIKKLFINKRFNFIDNKFYIEIAFFIILSLFIKLAFAPFNVPIREDAYIYLLKSIEITKGNFTPAESYSIGWSLFMAPFFFFIKNHSIFINMIYARVISILISSFSIIPLAIIGKKVLKNGVILLLVLYTFSFFLFESAVSALSEPILIFFTLLAIMFIILAENKQKYYLLASISGAIAYWMRPNGLFILPVILLSYIFSIKNIKSTNTGYLFYILIIFIIISFPMLYQRYNTFNSPFFYGENNKLFIDNYQQVWSKNIPIPSLLSYLRTHNLNDYIYKFILHGFLSIIKTFTFNIMNPLILFFFIIGIFRSLWNKRLISINFTLLIFIFGLIPVWDIFGTLRHLYVTIPFLLLLTTIALNEITEKYLFRRLTLFIFISIYIINSFIIPLKNWDRVEATTVKDGLIWSKWVANNIKGKIGIIEGGDLIMMNLPDTEIGGIRNVNYYAPNSDISVIRPGYFSDLNSALIWMRENKITHIVLDDNNIYRRPYLQEVVSKKSNLQRYFKEIYSNYDTGSIWKVKIYQII